MGVPGGGGGGFSGGGGLAEGGGDATGGVTGGDGDGTVGGVPGVGDAGGGVAAPLDAMRMSAQFVKNSGWPEAMPHQPGVLPYTTFLPLA